MVMSQRVLTETQKKEREKAGYLCKTFFFVSSQTRTAPTMFIVIPGNREVFVTWRAILLLHEGVLSSHLRAMWYVEMLCFDVTLEEEAN